MSRFAARQRRTAGDGLDPSVCSEPQSVGPVPHSSMYPRRKFALCAVMFCACASSAQRVTTKPDVSTPSIIPPGAVLATPEQNAAMTATRDSARAALTHTYGADLKRTGANAPSAFWFLIAADGHVQKSGIGNPTMVQAGRTMSFVFQPGDVAARQISVIWLYE